MTPPTPTVFVVDDDQAITESLRWLIESDGLKVETFSNGQSLLNALDNNRIGCIVLDIRMPGLSGIELQEKLKAQKKHFPVIFITGHGDVPMAVRAMKMGAADFLTKPFRDHILLETIHKAIADNQKERNQQELLNEINKTIAILTPREFEVMQYVVAGKLSKAIAIDLGIGNKTVEIHRARIMKKMRAHSLADLVKKVF